MSIYEKPNPEIQKEVTNLTVKRHACEVDRTNFEAILSGLEATSPNILADLLAQDKTSVRFDQQGHINGWREQFGLAIENDPHLHHYINLLGKKREDKCLDR